MTRLKSASVVLLSCLTILLALLSLAQLDFRMVLFMRSVHLPVLEQIGNLGNRLGHGETLIILCVVLFLIGYFWKKEAWRLAGIDGVVAHAIAGIAVQIPKHVIGRPRPRWTHQQAFEYGPSFQGGLDAFPSGHAAASFAVAAVLARYFPKGTWLWYGAALFVALSRVVRGSHFLTDAMAGAVLGFLIGYVWARPVKEWKVSLIRAFPRTLPLLVVVFSLIWVACHPPVIGKLVFFAQWVGIGVCVLGLGLRVFWSVKGDSVFTPFLSFVLGTVSVGLGLALVSQSMIVAGLSVLALLAWWLIYEEVQERRQPRLIAHEVLLACAFLSAVFLLKEVSGLVPLV